MKQRNKKTLKVVSKSIFFVLTLFLLVLSIAYIPNSHLDNGKVILKAGSWNSDLAEIDNVTTSSNVVYKNIKDYVNINVANGLVDSVKDPATINAKINNEIKIMLVDGLDVYYFSEICNRLLSNGTDNLFYEQYLGFDYVLGADIDYEDASKTFKMLRPIGWGNKTNTYDHTFHGTFDGRGYTITNIFYRPFDDAVEYDKFYSNVISETESEGMVDVAWFSNNNGTIKNLGIINPNVIQYDIYSPAISISPFIGNNDTNGVVENCFVQDLRGNGAGLLAEGGYDMTMFATSNSGIIKNCYVASDRISSGSVSMTSKDHRYPFINTAKKPLINCYYDGQILDASKNTYNEKAIEGLTKLQTGEFQTDKFNNTDKIWHSDATYGTKYAPYIKLKYPVIKGLAIEKVDGIDYFKIEDAVDLVYMSELVDKYQPFRSASYLLTNSVDLNSVKKDSFVFTSAVFSGVLKGDTRTNTGVVDPYQVDLTNGKASNLHSIINLNVHTGISYNGYHCYGLFGIMSGVVQDLNLVNVSINQDDIDVSKVNYGEINTIGAVCGLLEGGAIKNVNVLTDIKLQSGTSTTYLGKENVGGICGTATKGLIQDCTTKGTITAPVYDTKINASHQYDHSIGGILGRAENNDGVKNCLNTITITVPTYTKAGANKHRQYVGGVIGSGFIKGTDRLQNNAAIIIPSANYYSTMYIGGVIGRVEGASGENGTYLNNANITYNVNDRNYKAYISGVMNVISNVADKYDKYSYDGLNVNNAQNEINNLETFTFKSLSNAGTLNIQNGLSVTKLPAKYQVITSVSNGIDIRTAGIAYSYLTNFSVVGAYNLNKYYTRVNGNISDANPLGAQEIDISMIDKFAPTFNADNRIAYQGNKLHYDTNYLATKSKTINNSTPKLEASISVERCYNYRDINYITNKQVDAYTLQLSGSVNGKNFNLTNIRNEGNIKVLFSHDTHLTLKMDETTYKDYFGDYKKLKVFGVMEEVSLNHRAKDIYNGGNITVSSISGVVPNFNLYVSGICYKNVGNDPAVNEQLMIKRGYVGSLHNCVNNGTIRITNGDILTKNPTVGGDFYGQSRASGIACINSSTISSTFNLGNIYNINNVHNVEKYDKQHIKDYVYGGYSDTGEFEVETGGFCFIMQNEVYDTKGNTTRGNIIDSANNGIVVSMNTGTNHTWTNAGGFVGRNDRSEDGPTVDKPESISKIPHLEKIEYSINYGDIYAYNRAGKGGGEPSSKAAGFVCLGACTVVDVINYGRIYSDRIASGMFGYLMMGRMINAKKLAKNNDPMNIANAINYGIVKNLEITDANMNKIMTIQANDSVQTLDANNSNDIIAGALIGMLTGISTDSDLDFINVKNLINFNDKLNILGKTNGVTDDFTNAGKKRATQYMATTNPNDKSPAPFNKGSSSTYEYGVRSYSKDTKDPNPNAGNVFSAERNGGIFNKNYVLRNAPALDVDGNGVVNPNNTDNFIADYIQFIPYSKVNDELIVKIGLKDVVLANALENARNSFYTINGLIKHLNKTDAKMNTVYKDLINSQSAKLETVKNDLLVEIKKSINTTNYTREELIGILQILMQNQADLNAVCGLTEVKEIISPIIDGLNQSEIDDLINTIIGDNANLTEIITKHKTEFLTYLDLISQAKEITTEQLGAIRTMYRVLTDDASSLNAYINSLTQEQKETLSNELYALLKDNQTIRNIVINRYPDISFDNQTNVNKLLEVIIPNTTDSTVLTDNEYNKIYDFIKVNNAIDSLTQNDLETILNKLTNASKKSNSNLYGFLESGRSNFTGLYLPVTKANYVNIINKTEFYVTNENDANFTYSGNVKNLNGDGKGNLVELSVLMGENNQDSGLFSGVTYALNGTNFTAKKFGGIIGNAGSAPNPSYKVTAGSNTGVFGEAVSGQVNGYNDYENVQIFKYIDYGQTAVAKHSLNLTEYMMVAINSLDITVVSNKNKIIEYIKMIYNNSTVNKQAFLDILYANNPTPTTPTKQEKLTYIKNNLTPQNVDEALNIVNNKNNVKHDVANKVYPNHDYMLDTLLIELDSVDNVNNNKIKELIHELFNQGAIHVSQNTELLDAMKFIINGQPLDNKKQIAKWFADFVGSDIIKSHYNELTNEQLARIINLFFEQDINLLYQYVNELTPKFKYDLKAAIASYLIRGNEALFKKYIYNGTTLEGLIELLNQANMDPSEVTDYTGIYALASSYGIEEGLFLPDNVKLVNLDPYKTNLDGTEYQDPTWRGGSIEEPNGYDVNNKDTVNYKVYYEMKQLKKSIATMVFRLELVGMTGAEADYSSIIKNNIEYNYHIDGNNSVIDFFIPRNHDILQKEKLVIYDQNGHYELSYGATFDTATDKLEIPLKSTYTVGEVLHDTFVVQAEDTRVKQTYTVNVHITQDSRLDPLNKVVVDGVNGTVERATVNVGGVNVTNAKVTTKVKGFNGKLRVEYGTINLQNHFDLLPTTKVYRTTMASIADINLANYTTYIDPSNALNLNTDYVFSNDVVENGKVVITGTDDTGLQPNGNEYKSGKVIIGIDLGNYLTKGVYALEVAFNQSLKYYVFFEKAASTRATVDEISYNGHTFNGSDGASNNQNDMATHPFGKPMTEADFKDITTLADGSTRPTYLDSLTIAPLASYKITKVEVAEGTYKTYKVTYTITAESGATQNFVHFIKESTYDTNIDTVYINGGVSQITTPSDPNLAYEDSFEKTENPSYRFEYNLQGFYADKATGYFKVVFCDSQGNPVPAGAELDKLNSSVTINITQGRDFEVIFLNESPSLDYYIRLEYVHELKFNAQTTLNWDVKFKLIKLSKLKNRNSYFENIVFSSEAVIASIRTMIDVNNITYEQYEQMLKSPERPIVCLPGKIHYNEYDYNRNKQTDFYVIGLVSKTMLDFYTPTFTVADGAKVYRTEKFNNELYLYLPYYSTDQQNLTTFLVSEDGLKFKNEMGADITVTGNKDAFTFEGVQYTLSPVHGYTAVTVNGVLIENTSLRTNYNESGIYNEAEHRFEYVSYRVYAEIYDTLTDAASKAEHVTDYHIATQDITNNIRFNVTIDKVQGCTIDQAAYNVYAEFICYSLIEGGKENEKVRDDNYYLNNRAGLFAYFNGGNEAVHETLQANQAGWYKLNIMLPDGYTFEFSAGEKGKADTINHYQAGEEFFIKSGLVAKTIEIHITIKEGTKTGGDWGVHEDSESIFK